MVSEVDALNNICNWTLATTTGWLETGSGGVGRGIIRRTNIGQIWSRERQIKSWKPQQSCGQLTKHNSPTLICHSCPARNTLVKISQHTTRSKLLGGCWLVSQFKLHSSLKVKNDQRPKVTKVRSELNPGRTRASALSNLRIKLVCPNQPRLSWHNLLT